MSASVETEIWKPQPGPQTLLCKCHIQDILYGGARGGGKTDGALGHWMFHVLECKEFAKGLFVRRTTPELEEVISRAKVLFGDVAVWKEQKKTLFFNNGGVLKFRFIERDSDADKYQGHEYSWICIEEAGNFGSPIPIDKLRATLRSTAGIKTWFLMTANPGGIGHNWLKARYVDPSPALRPFTSHMELPDGTVITTKRIFIPSKLSDNQILVKSQPGYISNVALAAAGQAWLLSAWLDGNWNIVAGGMFDDLYNPMVHVLEPFEIPKMWTIYRAYDWGSSKPFSIGWWAVSDGSRVKIAPNQYHTFPKDTLVRIDEWYGWNGQVNQGLNMLERDIAQKVKAHEKAKGWEVESGPADPMIFNESNGGCLNDDWETEDITWIPADKGLRVTGWQQVRQMLYESTKPHPENPCLYVFNTCEHWIRTVPTLPRSKTIIDDANSAAEDHVADETRYMVRFKPQLIEEHELSGT